MHPPRYTLTPVPSFLYRQPRNLRICNIHNPLFLHLPINDNVHPSTHPSTSPSTSYSQTRAFPASHSPHYAPCTSRTQTHLGLPPSAHCLAAPSSPESRRRTPSKGKAPRRGRGIASFSTEVSVGQSRGRWL